MRLVKLDATDSTNSHLRRMMSSDQLEDRTVVWANLQEAGRGQQGTVWASEKGKNLTFSMLYNPTALQVQHHFILNCAVSLGIFRVLNGLKVPRLRVKWPNDIMSGGLKLCGILIENTLIQNRISHCIIGIGLNVNQAIFSSDLPKAVSMKQLLQKDFDREELLVKLVESIGMELEALSAGETQSLHLRYQDLLYKRNQPHMFSAPSGQQFMGIIQGVSESGLLVVQLEDESIQYFDFKALSF